MPITINFDKAKEITKERLRDVTKLADNSTTLDELKGLTAIS